MAEPVAEPVAPVAKRRPTTSSALGVGRREGHDACSFYARITPPRLSDDAEVARPTAVDTVRTGRHFVGIDPDATTRLAGLASGTSH
jgi:hypothetical protein